MILASSEFCTKHQEELDDLILRLNHPSVTPTDRAIAWEEITSAVSDCAACSWEGGQ